MFVGHYGPSFAVKALGTSIPLWLLFLAVQLVDVVWAVLVLLGIEKVKIVPGITVTNPLDLYYMPYTHSLVATLLWSGAAILSYRYAHKLGKWFPAVLVGLAVLSHWVLDLLVHRPDLPLYDNSFKVGLGLWNYPVIASVLEAALLFGGLFYYLHVTRPVGRGGKYGMVIFGVIMLAVQFSVFFGPPPSSDKAVAVMALVSYFMFAGVAYWLERKRA